MSIAGAKAVEYAALAEQALDTSQASDDAERRILDAAHAQAWALLAVAASVRDLAEAVARPREGGPETASP